MSSLSIEGISSNLNLAIPQGGATDELRLGKMMGDSKSEGASEGPQSFGAMLKESFDKVNTYQHQADTAMKELVAGKSKNIHETMLAIERADSSLKLLMQVRNKLLDAYREVIRMQV